LLKNRPNSGKCYQMIRQPKAQSVFQSETLSKNPS